MPPGYITYATAGAIRDKIRNGEPFDSRQESVVGPSRSASGHCNVGSRFKLTFGAHGAATV
jgi:hypothetical protein